MMSKVPAIREELCIDGSACPSCRADRSAVIGVNIPGVYDGVLFWACMNCSHAWHRWPVNHYLHNRAAPYVRRTVLK